MRQANLVSLAQESLENKSEDAGKQRPQDCAQDHSNPGQKCDSDEAVERKLMEGNEPDYWHHDAEQDGSEQRG